MMTVNIVRYVGATGVYPHPVFYVSINCLNRDRVRDRVSGRVRDRVRR